MDQSFERALEPHIGKRKRSSILRNPDKRTSRDSRTVSFNDKCLLKELFIDGTSDITNLFLRQDMDLTCMDVVATEVEYNNQTINSSMDMSTEQSFNMSLDRMSKSSMELTLVNQFVSRNTTIKTIGSDMSASMIEEDQENKPSEMSTSRVSEISSFNESVINEELNKTLTPIKSPDKLPVQIPAESPQKSPEVPLERSPEKSFEKSTQKSPDRSINKSVSMNECSMDMSGVSEISSMVMSTSKEDELDKTITQQDDLHKTLEPEDGNNKTLVADYTELNKTAEDREVLDKTLTHHVTQIEHHNRTIPNREHDKTIIHEPERSIMPSEISMTRISEISSLNDSSFNLPPQESFYRPSNESFASSRTSGVNTLIHNLNELDDCLHHVDELISQSRQRLDKELVTIFEWYRHIVNKDNKYEFAVSILGLRHNIWLIFKVDPEKYPYEKLDIKFAVNKKDRHLYPLAAYALAVRKCTQEGKPGYLTRLITNAQRFRRFLRKINYSKE